MHGLTGLHDTTQATMIGKFENTYVTGLGAGLVSAMDGWYKGSRKLFLEII